MGDGVSAASAASPPVGRWKRRLAVIVPAAAGVLAAAGWYLLRPYDPSHELRELTGGRHVRAAWARDDRRGRGFSLVVVDSRDGRGVRKLRSGLGYLRGIRISRGGDHVIFTDARKREMFVIGFDGSDLRRVPARGSTEDVWQDPRTGREWGYFMDVGGGVARFRLDRPDHIEPVFTGAGGDTTENGAGKLFTVAPDGRHIAGHTAHPQCGVWDSVAKRFTFYGNGCFPSVAPDGSGLFFHFDGAHRNLIMHTADRARSWKVDVARLPGKVVRETYHPRWTNDVRYIVLAGPYENWSDRDLETEVYLGRLNADFTAVEKWVPLSRNGLHEFAPAVWIEPDSPDDAAAFAAWNPYPTLAEAGASGPGRALEAALLYRWESSRRPSYVSRPGAEPAISTAKPRGAARYDRRHGMELSGGSFVGNEMPAPGPAPTGLTLEAIVTPERIDYPEMRAVAKLTDGTTPDWTLAQRADRLFLTAGGAAVELCGLRVDEPHHILLSVSRGSVGFRLNGAATTRKDLPTAAWSAKARRLEFGGDWAAGLDWAGNLEGISLFDRPLTDAEGDRLWRGRAAEWTRRRPVERLVVQAVPTQVTAPPRPQAILPYVRCLVECTYRIERVIEGSCADREIVVAHWGILDGRPVPAAQALRVGGSRRLVLERLEDHPQLESERRVGDDIAVDLPVYHDVSPVSLR